MEPAAPDSDELVVTREDVVLLRSMLADSTTELISLEREAARSKTGISSVLGKKITAFKRLTTWIHMALAANRTNRARLRNPDAGAIFHFADMSVGEVVLYNTAGIQQKALENLVDFNRKFHMFCQPGVDPSVTKDSPKVLTWIGQLNIENAFLYFLKWAREQRWQWDKNMVAVYHSTI